jgi:tRNA threonylcarbamoyladenosine biosynthesis protein TsaE
MHPPHTVELIWTCEADTDSWARQLAACPQARDAIVTLHGDLGAGKTTFVRHVLRAMGVPGRIKSPTYAVVEPHQAMARWATWRFGTSTFTGLKTPVNGRTPGSRDLFASPGLKLVEWPDKAGPTPARG